MLIPYVLFVAYLLLRTPASPTLETLAATYGSLAAAIVGYYFGQTPVKAALSKANEASAQQQKLKSNTINILSELALIQQQLQSHKDMIQELHNRNEGFRKEFAKDQRFAANENLKELADPEVMAAQRDKVRDNVQQIQDTMIRINDLRNNSMQLLA